MGSQRVGQARAAARKVMEVGGSRSAHPSQKRRRRSAGWTQHLCPLSGLLKPRLK